MSLFRVLLGVLLLSLLLARPISGLNTHSSDSEFAGRALTPEGDCS